MSTMPRELVIIPLMTKIQNVAHTYTRLEFGLGLTVGITSSKNHDVTKIACTIADLIAEYQKVVDEKTIPF